MNKSIKHTIITLAGILGLSFASLSPALAHDNPGRGHGWGHAKMERHVHGGHHGKRHYRRHDHGKIYRRSYHYGHGGHHAYPYGGLFLVFDLGDDDRRHDGHRHRWHD